MSMYTAHRLQDAFIIPRACSLSARSSRDLPLPRQDARMLVQRPVPQQRAARGSVHETERCGFESRCVHLIAGEIAWRSWECL